ncbi:ANTAR domain-containing protein [Streptomyces fructofermentans]|uniref:ANTAR domain-containing protein n=1 Tax=Streptomyces fructofermentans TaxID=152141 RepID=UPI00378FA054
MKVDADEPSPGAPGTPKGPAGQQIQERLGELREENEQLQEAVRSHAVVDQAIGVVVVLGRLAPEQGWQVLREVSQRTNIKLREVAESIVEWPRTEKLRDDIRIELERQLTRHAGPPHAGA